MKMNYFPEVKSNRVSVETAPLLRIPLEKCPAGCIFKHETNAENG